MSKVSIITAGEATALVGDSMTVTTSGFVAKRYAEALSKALEQRFLETGSPRDLTLFMRLPRETGTAAGADHFAHEGMTKRVIGGHWNMVPQLGRMVLENKIEGLQPPAGNAVSVIP